MDVKDKLFLSRPYSHNMKNQNTISPLNKAFGFLLAVFTACLCFVACSAGEAKPNFAAAEAAKQYYDSLSRDGYEYFTSQTFRPESIPDNYREQLVANTKMYWRKLCEERGGVKEIRVADCRKDSIGINADAFLLFCFNDSTSEEVVVHMVKQGDKWWMK